MKDCRLLLIGRGHLGTFLKDRLCVANDLHYTSELAQLDAPAIARLKPDMIVNTAGKTDLRWCEDNALETFRCNVAAPLAVWRAIQLAGLRETLFVQLSSGCIWDGPYGDQGKPFEPNTPPRPACFYSWTKASCDALLMQEKGDHALCILRPRQVYSPLPSQRNTLTKLRVYPRLIDTPNSMTSAETIARTIEQVAAQPALFKSGRVLNVYDRGITSPFRVATLLAQAGLRGAPSAMTKQDLDRQLKPKRVDAVIHDEWFERLVQPPEVEAELIRVIDEYKRAVTSP
jgi:dTDP-4-dehydrorhamnose reductase